MHAGNNQTARMPTIVCNNTQREISSPGGLTDERLVQNYSGDRGWWYSMSTSPATTLQSGGRHVNPDSSSSLAMAVAVIEAKAAIRLVDNNGTDNNNDIGSGTALPPSLPKGLKVMFRPRGCTLFIALFVLWAHRRRKCGFCLVHRGRRWSCCEP